MAQCIHDAYDDLDSAAQGLCQLALANKSQDNLSIQICRVEARGTASQADAVTVLSRLPFPPFLQVGHILDGLTIKKILHESERSQVYLVHTQDGTPLVMKTPQSITRMIRSILSVLCWKAGSARAFTTPMWCEW